MNTNTKTYLLTAAAVMITATKTFASFGDGTISISTGLGNANGGGAFAATTTPSGSGSALGNFYTFCVEYTEHISYGSQFSYIINSGSVKGGYSTDPNGGPTFDPLSKGTAYLYGQWRSGGIANTAANANLLQEAIWYLEGETSLKPDGSGAALSGTGTPFSYTQTAVLANPYLTIVSSQFGGYSGAAAAATPGEYGVVILNVYQYDHAGDGNYIVQDQLGVVPEPSTIVAGILLLLPFGASTIRILRKNRAA